MLVHGTHTLHDHDIHRLPVWPLANLLLMNLSQMKDSHLSQGMRSLLTRVYLFDLSSDFDVVFERPNGDQTVSMEYDDPDSGVSLDRSNYPQNTGVVITIDDQALNVDPTVHG